jgi:hypothetical protein
LNALRRDQDGKLPQSRAHTKGKIIPFGIADARMIEIHARTHCLFGHLKNGGFFRKLKPNPPPFPRPTKGEIRTTQAAIKGRAGKSRRDEIGG